MCAQVYDLCKKYRGQLLLDVPLEALADFPTAGLHLGAAHLHEFSQRPISHERLFTCECGNIGELKQAKLLDADAVLFSSDGNLTGDPAAQTQDHKAFLRAYTVPSFTPARISSNDFRSALNSGCYGIAVSADILNGTSTRETEKDLKDIAHLANVKLGSR